MAIRRTTHVLKNTKLNNQPLPTTGSTMGEPLVNLYNGILYFSGVTGGDYTQSNNNSGYFEVGSNLYNLKLRNKIVEYQGFSGSSLVGKFLSGTTNGFVLADITDLDVSDTFVTGFTYDPNTNLITVSRNQGEPDLPVSLSAFTNLNLLGTTNVNNITITGTGLYNSSATLSNEIVNYGTLTSFTQTTDVYVTGSTLTSANDNTKTQTSQLSYHGNPIGGSYSIITENTFTTGGTYDNSSKTITLTRNDGQTYPIDLSSIDVNDTYVTGGTTSGSTNSTPNATISLKYNQGVPDGTYTLPYTNTYVTGGTYNSGTITLTKNDGNQVNITGLLSTDTFVTGFTYSPSTNTFTISQNQGKSGLTATINSVSGLTITNLTPGQVVYVGGSNELKTDSTGEFSYNDSTNTLTINNGKTIINNGLSDGYSSFGQGGLVVGSGGSHTSPGLGDLTVHGNLVIFGSATTVSTNELYVEDPQITLNYNPSGDTSITSISSGIRIQDGDGLSGDTYFTIGQMNTFTGNSGDVGNISEYTGPDGSTNRAWITQLNDIVVRNTNFNNGAPDGGRVLISGDVLDGGIY